jgi:hypothetical protein
MVYYFIYYIFLNSAQVLLLFANKASFCFLISKNRCFAIAIMLAVPVVYKCSVSANAIF